MLPPRRRTGLTTRRRAGGERGSAHVTYAFDATSADIATATAATCPQWPRGTRVERCALSLVLRGRYATRRAIRESSTAVPRSSRTPHSAIMYEITGGVSERWVARESGNEISLSFSHTYIHSTSPEAPNLVLAARSSPSITLLKQLVASLSPRQNQLTDNHTQDEASRDVFLIIRRDFANCANTPLLPGYSVES